MRFFALLPLDDDAEAGLGDVRSSTLDFAGLSVFDASLLGFKSLLLLDDDECFEDECEEEEEETLATRVP